MYTEVSAVEFVGEEAWRAKAVFEDKAFNLNGSFGGNQGTFDDILKGSCEFRLDQLVSRGCSIFCKPSKKHKNFHPLHFLPVSCSERREASLVQRQKLPVGYAAHRLSTSLPTHSLFGWILHNKTLTAYVLAHPIFLTSIKWRVLSKFFQFILHHCIPRKKVKSIKVCRESAWWRYKMIYYNSFQEVKVVEDCTCFYVFFAFTEITWQRFSSFKAFI